MVFLVDYGKKGEKTLMHLKEFGFLYAGFLNHCQGTKRDCLWFFVLIQTMKVYQIISCQAKISQGKKNCESVFKPTAHVFIIFSVQKVLHVLHSWDCNNAKKDQLWPENFKKKLRFVHLCGALWVFMSCGILCMHWQSAGLQQKGIFFSKTNQISHSLKRSQYNRTLLWGLRWK